MAVSLARLAVVVGSLVVAVTSVEVGLRLVGLPTSHRHFALSDTYRLDPDLIYTLRPGARGTWRTAEFVETRRVNALGMRDETPKPRRAREVRILAVGDSFTYGHGVQMHESWPKVLQEMLRDRGIPTSVLNAGVPGWSLAQSFRYVLGRAATIDVDLVLLGLNDTDLGDAIDVPLYDVRDGVLVPLDATRTWIHLQGRLAHAIPRIGRHTHVASLVLSSLRHRDPYGQRPQLDADALGVWAREKMRLQITHLATTVATRGRSLVVVVTPAADAVAPIVDAIEETGIPVIRAFPPDRPDTTFPVDRHLTPLGNRLVAATVAGELVSRGLVRPAAVTRPTDSARDTMAGGRRPDGRAGR